MNTFNHLLVAAVAVATLNLTPRAAEPLLSPRAAQQRNELRTVSSMAEPDLTKDRPVGNAKAWELARSFRTVPTIGPRVDLAHAPRPTVSPKDPRFESAWRESAISQAEVAPLK